MASVSGEGAAIGKPIALSIIPDEAVDLSKVDQVRRAPHRPFPSKSSLDSCGNRAPGLDFDQARSCNDQRTPCSHRNGMWAQTLAFGMCV